MTLPAEKIRVMHVIETLEMGGAENVVANLVNLLSDRFEPTVCCTLRSGAVADKIRDKRIEIVVLGGKSAGNDYGLPFHLADVMRQRRIDVAHSHDWGTLCETAAAAFLAKTPVCVHMGHGPTSAYSETDPLRGLKSFVRHRIERAASLKIGRFIAVSDRVRKEFIEEIGVPARKVELVHNGIEVGAPPAFDASAKRREIGLTDGDRVLCTVGRLAAIKNYGFLLENFPKVLAEFPRTKLIMIGEGPERARLEKMVREMNLENSVFMLGERGDVREWLSLSHVFLLPSFYEGISIALLEALGLGVPAVATRVGGTPEVIRDGESGLLVAVGDGDGLARAVIGLLKNESDRRRMGEAARNTVEREFNLATISRRYESIYLEELGKKGFKVA